MKNYFRMQSIINRAIPWLWAAVWFTLPLSMKANGLSLILLGLAVVIQAVWKRPVIQRQELILAGLFILFFAWHGASFIFDPAKYEVWKSLERKISLVAIPVIMLLMTLNGKDLEKWAIRGFFAGLIATGLHMLAMALAEIAAGNPVTSYTYHEFTGPYSLGAIYYSCYISAALYYLAFKNTEKIIVRIKWPLSIFFMVLLLFCASKLFIAITIPAIVWPVVKRFFKEGDKIKWTVPIIVLIVVVAGLFPFFNRLSELKNTDLSVVTQEEYRYDTPLNGLTFRMILWRFAGEIMRDENAWLTGTGTGSRQHILNEYYKKYGIYLGNPDLGDTGYLNYNFHSEYLEVLVGTGIPGLIILLMIIVFIFFPEKNELFFPKVVYIIVILFFVTESVLERQAGIVFFCLIWTMRIRNLQNTE